MLESIESNMLSKYRAEMSNSLDQVLVGCSSDSGVVSEESLNSLE